MVLPDTSVWVDYSRRGAQGNAAAMRRLLDRGEVATCGPVVAELLAGADGEVGERLWTTLSSLPWAHLPTPRWREVGQLANTLRRRGQTVPLTDLVIAIAAVRDGHVLWSLDTDFERIAPVLDGLELYAA
ncbi:MAG TPA: PIN domain-containing protein [Solirubrobacterales bacterium]|nr:PIN domain-containing protein [Solirubrobacterales bacterium]